MKFKRGDIVRRKCDCCRDTRLKVVGYEKDGLVRYEEITHDGFAFDDELQLCRATPTISEVSEVKATP